MEAAAAFLPPGLGSAAGRVSGRAGSLPALLRQSGDTAQAATTVWGAGNS